MVFDGVFLFDLIRELNKVISKGRLEKIYQTGELSFIFIFYHRSERTQLEIDLSPHHFSMHMTKKKAQVSMTSQFLSMLKKQLEGAILEQITQHETDRVAIFEFTSYDYIDGPIKKELVFEAMGKHSNLILVKDSLIVDTFKKMFFLEGRQLIPGAHFQFFPTDKKPFTTIDYKKITDPKMLVNTYMGISPFLAPYLFETKKQIHDLTFVPTRCLDSQKAYVVDVFSDCEQKKTYDTISEMIDDQVQPRQLKKSPHRQFIEKQIKKYELKVLVAEQDLVNANESLIQRTYGDMIYQSGLPLDRHDSEIMVGENRLVLDPTKSLNENAQLFYKQYQKAKRAIAYIETQLKEHRAMLELFIQFQTYLDISTSEHLSDLEADLSAYGFKQKTQTSKHKKPTKPLITMVELDGDLYMIGRNSRQNAYLTHQLAQKDDYWFHVKDAPGGHIVLRTSHLCEKNIRLASMLAAYHSRLNQSSSIPVDYTQVKYIKKIPGLQSYQVSYQHHQTMFIDIDEKMIEDVLKQSKSVI